MTLERFYSDLRTRSRLSPRSVVVLDEAGAVGLESVKCRSAVVRSAAFVPN
jgi:hypothetical protein